MYGLLIKEKKAPDGYSRMPTDMLMRFKYNSVKARWECYNIDNVNEKYLIDATGDDYCNCLKKHFTSSSIYDGHEWKLKKVRTTNHTTFGLKIKNYPTTNKKPLTLKINKMTPNGTKLIGSKFEVSYTCGTTNGKKEFDLTEITSDSILLGKFDITKTVTVTIKETPPEGYTGITPITIKFRYNKTDKEWYPFYASGDMSALKAFGKKNGFTNYYSNKIRSNTSGLCEINVINTRQNPNFEIIKKDANGNLKTGVKFRVSIVHIEGVRFGKTVYLINEDTKNTDQYKNVNCDKVIVLKNNRTEIDTSNGKIALVKTSGKDDRITIENLSTDTNGKIVIDEILAEEGKNQVNISITETENGKLPDPGQLQLLACFNDDNKGEWKLYERREGSSLAPKTDWGDKQYDNKLTNQAYWSINSNKNKCTVTIINDSDPALNLKIHKKRGNGNSLSGATFTAKYYQQDEKGKYPETPFATESATSDTSGIANFKNVIPPTTKNIKVVVKETGRPSGYAGLYSDIELEFSYNGKSDSWKLMSTPENSDVSNVKVTSTNTKAPKHNTTTIEFDVKNTPTVGNFTIFKEDMDGQRISDIGFSVYLNNIKSVKVENEEILLTDIGKGQTIDIGNGITIERIVEESTGDSNRITIHGLKTDSEGKITIPEIVPSENAKVIFVTVTEESGKAGFVTLPKKLRLLLLRDETTDQWKLYERKPGKIPAGYSSNYTDLQNELPEEYWSPSDNNEVAVTLKNDSKIDKLVINKVDQQDNSKKVKGAKFRVTTTNIKSINGKDGVTTVDVETNDDGNFTLENLVIEDVTKDITLTIKETAAPTGYKLIQGEIVVTLHRKGEKYTISETTVVGNVDEKEFKPGAVTLDNHVLNLNIEDIPIMQMGGKVWLDGQTGIKPEYPANGKLDNGEIGVENVKVALYKGNELIVKDVYGNELSTATDENGNYLFSNIEKGTNYRIEFTYDGIKFERTIAGDSKAEEKDRPGFNNKFETINVGETGTGIHLDYATEGNKSRLISSDSQLIQRDGNNKITKLNMGNVRENFKIDAQSGNYLNNENDWLESWKEVTSCEARNINLGLVERGVDLSLVADVASARVTINGKEKEYPYSEISNNLINIKPEEIGETTSSEETEYVLDLPEADYNFRLGDYLAENYLEFDYMDKTNYIKELRENSAELKIYVTYKIHLNNQSTNIAKVNSIVDYYSENYTYLDNSAKYVKYDGSTEKEISGAQISVNTDNGTQTIGDNTYKKMEIEINDTSNDSKLTDGGRNILYLTFEVNGTGPDIEANINGEGEIRYGNIAEITSYSTEEGYVDVDSAPGNAIQDGDLRLEDDTDKAPLLNINVESSKIRKTDGLVWEDENVNGKREDSEKLVNNVIVQLVELKTLIVNNQTFNIEYVWQEMLSGSGSLLRANYNTEKNGIEPVKESVTRSDGSYTFQNYIPGNYVIRFIYGDGTMIKYNGQDYKSTIDNAYNQEVFNENNYGTDKTESIARDNESRRLNVMSYSVDVDSKKGMLLKLLNVDDNYEPYYKKLNDNYYSDTEKKILAEICGCDVASLTTDMLKGKLNDVLKETYMYADTSRIEVPVDNNDTSLDECYEYENMNFGLTERPKNKLTLEKHVTGLQVQVNSKDIANATADNAGTAADPIEKLKGTRKGLTAFRATRENRGAWKLETDIEELLQGATIKVEYTYTATQEGETDYLSEQLQNDYKTFSVEDYTEKLKDYANKNKPNGTYLTPGYYLGNSATPISLSRVEKVEDYYEHITDTNKSEETEDLKFVEGDTEGFVSIDSPEKTKKKAYILKTDGNSGDELFTMNKTVTNETPFDLLEKIENDKHPYSTKVANTSKVLSSFNQDAELSFKSYIAQITEYSTATGRRDLSSTPGNLNYIYYQSESLNTMNNEDDEFWAEDVTITKPTGEDKTSMTTIIIIATSSLATLVVAIILIKKFIIGKTPKQ